MQTYQTTLGRLQCVVVDTVTDQAAQESASESAKLLSVVLCHGFGASGTDLVGLAPELCELAPELVGHTRFLFPAAPIPLDEVGMPGGRAWWHLDLEAFNHAINTGTFRDQTTITPDGLDHASQLLGELVQDIQSEWQTGPERIVLGGFSQGSMLATNVALSLPQPPAALLIWSGTLLCQDNWRQKAEARGPLRVFQSHGTLDPILPFDAAESLRDLLTESQLDVDFLEFSGQHAIPQEAVSRTATLLAETLAN